MPISVCPLNDTTTRPPTGIDMFLMSILIDDSTAPVGNAVTLPLKLTLPDTSTGVFVGVSVRDILG